MFTVSAAERELQQGALCETPFLQANSSPAGPVANWEKLSGVHIHFPAIHLPVMILAQEGPSPGTAHT